MTGSIQVSFRFSDFLVHKSLKIFEDVQIDCAALSGGSSHQRDTSNMLECEIPESECYSVDPIKSTEFVKFVSFDFAVDDFKCVDSKTNKIITRTSKKHSFENF